MIGTHDSFTYLSPRNKIFKLFSFLWRTQTKSLEEQLKLGVQYFDVRVRRSRNKWRVCHGIVDFNLTFNRLSDIFNYMPGRVRLILEKGDILDESLFKKEIAQCIEYPNLAFSCIKKGWIVLINRDPKLIDYTYIPWLSNLTFWENIKRFNFFSTIKRNAKECNTVITENKIKDPTVIYFMDYV